MLLQNFLRNQAEFKFYTMSGNPAKERSCLLLKKGGISLEARPCVLGPMNITVEGLHPGSDLKARTKVGLKNMKSVGCLRSNQAGDFNSVSWNFSLQKTPGILMRRGETLVRDFCHFQLCPINQRLASETLRIAWQISPKV